ncbi:hypothetical protein J0A68_11335 [Algoriphagus sp. H41]|uniref:Uncharacterized protein n=1 Tax=Algoriphagus oliviformis TaxID=2811231 RepID=A0ABS3C5X2_9BACT|nr:hypothetical protein [Algoriphagus oliviformis]MBN7811546.1 hypothetical protein [Algoriphagus oliviformis]
MKTQKHKNTKTQKHKNTKTQFSESASFQESGFYCSFIWPAFLPGGVSRG